MRSKIASPASSTRRLRSKARPVRERLDEDVPVVVAEVGPGDEERRRAAPRRSAPTCCRARSATGDRRAAVDAHVAAELGAAAAAAAEVDVLERQTAGRAVAFVDPGDQRVAGAVDAPARGSTCRRRRRRASTRRSAPSFSPAGVEARQLDAPAVVDAPGAELLPDDEQLAAVAAQRDGGPQLDDRAGRVVADAAAR